MANKTRWYKRDPNAALEGMAVLSLEERGAYNTVLDLIYTKDGKVDDDDRFLAGWMRVDVRVWRRIRTRLIDLGKLYVDGAYLRNERADSEVGKALLRITSAEEAGRASAAKREADRNNDNGLASTTVERTLQQSTSTSTSTSRQRPSPAPSPGAARAKEASEIANELLAPLPLSTRADARWRGFAAWIELRLDEGIPRQDLIIGVTQSISSLSGPPSTFDYFRPAIDRSINSRKNSVARVGEPVSTAGFRTYIESQLEMRRGDLVVREGDERLDALHAQFVDGLMTMADVIADLKRPQLRAAE